MIIKSDLHLDLTEYNSLDVSTFGGEFKDDDCNFNEYGIQIGELSFIINPEVAVTLCKKLKEHLEINGREIK